MTEISYIEGNSKDRDNKHYLLDAGTSTFDSSLSWFTCAYSQVSDAVQRRIVKCHVVPHLHTVKYQPLLTPLPFSPKRGISFNQIYGWEMTLLDPRNYWEKVPAKWKPYWHFFNTPISADPSHPDSPIRLIKAIATESECVRLHKL